MQRSYNRFSTSVTRPCFIQFNRIGCVMLVLFLLSCSTIPLTQRGTPLGGESALPPRYSLIFIIHGDGNYRYHDTSGKVHKADAEALNGAIRVAVQNSQAEVFIFHQIPRKHTLLFFPRRDGKFYYYRQGQMLAKESYWRHGPSRFDPEVELYHRFHTGDPARQMKFFLYFGHEIPELGGEGYDASYSHRIFTIHDLADGLNRITPDSAKFDLIVLSTCFNGTPYTIAALAPYTRILVASPENLHLSYFDLHPFEQLDVGLRDGDVTGFAKNFAQQAFDRLTEDIQTAVTVSVYDMDRVQSYVHRVAGVYHQALAALKDQKPGFFEHRDCAEDSAYVLPGMSDGVDIFYRPSRFGRSKHKLNHSGWECYRLLK